MSSARVELSVVIPTMNRSAMLAPCVRSVLRQHCSAAFEVIVVDNNSQDNTDEVVRQLSAEDSRVRYALEMQPGVASARNCGIKLSLAPIIAFIDDDEEAAPGWLQTIVDRLQAHPEVDFLGGRVLPIWAHECPSWLTHENWAPAGLMDHGDEERTIGAERPWPLGSGNMAVRRTAFDKGGLFATEFQRVGAGIGSTEDHEFVRRLWRSGCKGLYVPAMLAHSPVPAARMEKRYHRQWHHGHGRFSARMQLMEFPAHALTLFGTPPYCYKLILHELTSWARSMLSGRKGRAFVHESRVRDLMSYIAETYRMHRRSSDQSPPSELWRFISAYFRRGSFGG